MNQQEAKGLLQRALGDPLAEFREDQWEAIDALANKKQRLLVVQRTGWGKSAVYFLSARILRDQGRGPTIIISPLLALMRNQVAAAQRLGLRAVTINSSNTDDWQRISRDILSNKVDCILVSPERLANEHFVSNVLQPIASNIGLLVVDEAHCISDWGHDFRPDYRRILGILQQMPPRMPVLATTATANNRVIDDLVDQVGNLEVIRGPLVRDSLQLQNIRMPSQASRLAWLGEQIPNLPGTGIVYTLTTRDARQVNQWLNQHGVVSAAYYSGISTDEYPDSNRYREVLEDKLLNNELKVLVATSALGMGYDKPDLGFVIHYQSTGSVIDYYQQVGRAGRALNQAYGILLSGEEDNKIHQFFRESAFPTEDEVQEILEALESSDGLSVPQLEQAVNISKGNIDKALKFLSVESPAPLIKEGTKWVRTAVSYRLDHEKIQRLTSRRQSEWEQMQTYINSTACLMEFLRATLDDPQAQPCGRCSNCLGQPLLPTSVNDEQTNQASLFLHHAEILFKPKKRIPNNGFQQDGFRGILNQQFQSAEGRILSRWADAGWGQQVADQKHTNHFDDTLVEAMAEMIQQRWQPQPVPAWVTAVPSLNHPELVPDFAKRLANRLGLPYLDAVKKVRANEPQKMQSNAFHQCSNLDGVFDVPASIPAGPVLLVDDVIDSGWTMTLIAAKLKQKGSGIVYPVALATTAKNA